MIQIYSEMKDLADTLTGRFCKKEILHQMYSCSNLFIPENFN